MQSSPSPTSNILGKSSIIVVAVLLSSCRRMAASFASASLRSVEFAFRRRWAATDDERLTAPIPNQWFCSMLIFPLDLCLLVSSWSWGLFDQHLLLVYHRRLKWGSHATHVAYAGAYVRVPTACLSPYVACGGRREKPTSIHGVDWRSWKSYVPVRRPTQNRNEI